VLPRRQPGFLRALRLLRAYQIFASSADASRRAPQRGARRAALNVLVFVVMTSAVVYVTQRPINPKIANFVDALYFTVTSLTTTATATSRSRAWVPAAKKT
jgi:voltage-gated potassium channel